MLSVPQCKMTLGYVSLTVMMEPGMSGSKGITSAVRVPMMLPQGLYVLSVVQLLERGN